MFQQLLAPLDGSQLAEAALPVVAALAEQLSAQVTLFHVVENAPPNQVHGQPHLTNAEAARAYLATVTARYFATAAVVHQHVHGSRAIDVAQSIVAHTEELNTDLIVMCTHGSSTLHNRLFGSIAQRVIALGDVPVLLVNPDTTVKAFHCRHILVPLDGDSEHEQGLVLATDLARSCHATLELLMVVPTPASLSPIQAATGRLLPAATAALLDQAQEESRAILAEQTKTLAAQSLSVTGTVQRGDPAATITAIAQNSEADVVVLGTHGKSHMDAFWSGSVTPKLVAQLRTPVLLIPVRQVDSSNG